MSSLRIFIFFFVFVFNAFASISSNLEDVKKLPINERLAFWSEYFVGTPYDPIPIGNYVKYGLIKEDAALDCMSLTFRSLELTLSTTEEEALENALEIRFKTKGERMGNVVKSYNGRFEYGEDMALFGKFGRLASNQIGLTKMDIGTKRYPEGIPFLPNSEAMNNISKFKTGDIIYFVLREKSRKANEVVGHIGILKEEKGEMFLIHASGVKNKGGTVKKELFSQYLKQKDGFFIGILVNRL